MPATGSLKSPAHGALPEVAAAPGGYTSQCPASSSALLQRASLANSLPGALLQRASLTKPPGSFSFEPGLARVSPIKNKTNFLPSDTEMEKGVVLSLDETLKMSKRGWCRP
jgi:hypothetical protein